MFKLIAEYFKLVIIYAIVMTILFPMSSPDHPDNPIAFSFGSYLGQGIRLPYDLFVNLIN